MYNNALLFKSAFDASSIGMALVDPTGKFVKVNKSLCSFTGYSEKELTNLKFQDITVEEDLGPDLALMNECLEGKRDSYTLEKRYYKKDKGIVWILLTASLIRDKNNKPVVFVAHIQDITEMKMYRERKDLALSDWGIGVWTWYADKDLLIWDKAMMELYGVTEKEFKPNYAFFNQFLHKDDREDVAEKVSDSVVANTDFYTRFRIVLKNGSIKWIAGRGKVNVDSLGNVFMMTGINVDITEQVAEEDKLLKVSQIITDKTNRLEKDNGKKS